jgi:hypothetical protein
MDEVSVPGGWKAMVELAEAVHDLDCPIQTFILPSRSAHDALDTIKRVLDHIEAKGLKIDALYYDGYAAFNCLREDPSPAHPARRRQCYESQNACFAETRRRGIMPAAELARFWCMAECDYFFFTDWARDRLTNVPPKGSAGPVGDPIPLFQLVFNDCYAAGFSGGGYAHPGYHPGHDWWFDRTPRLYELLFASAPSYNWLPEPFVPVRDWGGEVAKRRWTWLKRWASYHRAVTMSEMVSHEFLSPDRKKQRIQFANGVVAEFDMAKNEMRVEGVDGFSGTWEKPEELPDYPR